MEWYVVLEHGAILGCVEAADHDAAVSHWKGAVDPVAVPISEVDLCDLDDNTPVAYEGPDRDLIVLESLADTSGPGAVRCGQRIVYARP